MRLIKILFRILPWFLMLLFGYLVWSNWNKITLLPVSTSSEEEIQRTVVERMETLGKLELVRYNFQEITEINLMGRDFYNLFKLESDSKVVLISKGEAVGCIDLTKIEPKHIRNTADTLFLQLPETELCYHKLDLDQTRIYALETGLFTNEKKFIERAYQKAEAQIEQAAYKSGILSQTESNAHLILKPLLQEIADKEIVFVKGLPKTKILLD